MKLRRSYLPLLLLTLLTLPGMLRAQEPELSADQPITFDAATQRLVAEGNAEFIDEATLVQADRMLYDQSTEQLRAEGNVRITRNGFRIVTDWLEYSVATKRFTAGPFRAGRPPIFIAGDGFTGTFEEIEIDAATLYYGEPQPLSPGLRAGRILVQPNEQVSASGVSVGVGTVQIPLPPIERSFAGPFLQAEVEPGYRQNLGPYLRSRWLYPFIPEWSMGANLDLYGKRGVLVGPALRHRSSQGDWWTRFDLSSGWINDFGDERDLDAFNRPIGETRYFADFGGIATHETTRFATRGTWLSDSEIERDFRDDFWETNPEPDNYVEGSYAWDGGLYLSAFLRYTPNDFYPVVERLPEFRLEQTSRALWDTGVYLSGHASYTRLQSLEHTVLEETPAGLTPFGPPEPATDDDLLAPLERTEGIDRGDLLLQLLRPLTLQKWLTLTPRLAGRYTAYSQDLERVPVGTDGDFRYDLGDRDRFRSMAELGLDLEGAFTGDFNLRNRTWGIDGLRHILRPVARYRWHTGVDDNDFAANYPDYRIYSPALPVIDLAQQRWVDDFTDRSLLRFGLENILLTRRTIEGEDERQEMRKLLELNLYRDVVFEGEQSHPYFEEDAYYLQMATQPARWLELTLDQKFGADEPDLEETRLQATITSAEQWQLRLSFDYLEEIIEQYSAEGFYQIDDTWAVFGLIRFDAERNQFTRQRYGLRQRLGSVWEINYFIALSEGSEREDSWRLGFSVRLLEF